MTRTSKRFKREIVSVGTVLASLLIYLPLSGSPLGIYIAACAGYTVLVFGLLWSDGKWTRYIVEGKHTAGELIQRHVVFVLILALWIWLCRFSRPWLPDWMFNYGPRELTLYLIFSGLGIVAIWWAEQSWLAKPPRNEERVGSSLEQ